MNFSDLLYSLERSEKPGKARVKKAGKGYTGKLSEEEIMKYRQMLKDENYMNKAVKKTAEIIAEALNGNSNG